MEDDNNDDSKCDFTVDSANKNSNRSLESSKVKLKSKRIKMKRFPKIANTEDGS